MNEPTKNIGALFITGFFLLLFPPGLQADGNHSHEEVKEIVVELSEFSFKPDVIELHGGETVHLIVRNRGTVLHEFVTDAFLTTPVELEFKGAEVVALGLEEFEVPAGGEIKLELTPRKRGKFDLTCLAEKPESHLKAGMKATILVQ